MTIYELTHTSEQLTIRLYNKTQHTILFGALAICACLLAILPIALLLFSILINSNYIILFLLISIICCSLGYHLLKLSLWKLNGKETIRVRKKDLTVECQYGIFKEKPSTYPFQQIEVAHQVTRNIANGETIKSNIYFRLEHSTIISHTTLPNVVIEEIAMCIHLFLNNQF